MPRIKKKLYTDTLYVRLQPVNDKFARDHTDKIGVSLSFFIDTLLDKIRVGKLRVKITRPITATDQKIIERQKRMAKSARASA